MKLLLIRHGKSSWDIPGQPDLERPLAARGHRQLKELAILLNQEGIWPEHVVVSPALRTQLSGAVLNQSGWRHNRAMETLDLLYEAETKDVLAWLESQVQVSNFIAIIGHNPWLNELIVHLTGVAIENLKTSGAALLSWDSDHFPEEGGAKLEWSHRLQLD